VPEGYRVSILIKWGDPLDNGEPLNWNRVYEGTTQEDVERQKKCFGYNADFVGFFKLTSDRALLVVNHEYTNPELMFNGFDLNTSTPTREQADLMLQAHGLSVVEIRRKSDGSWEYVKGSTLQQKDHGRYRVPYLRTSHGTQVNENLLRPKRTVGLWNPKQLCCG